LYFRSNIRWLWIRPTRDFEEPNPLRRFRAPLRYGFIRILRDVREHVVTIIELHRNCVLGSAVIVPPPLWRLL